MSRQQLTRLVARRWRIARQRRGTIVVLTAFLLIVMLGLIAFSVDVGYMMLTRTELHRAADASALAAAGELFNGQGVAVEKAKEYAGYHKAAGATIDVAEEDVVFGIWDPDTRDFTPSNDSGNAVQVTARRVDTPLFFSWVFGNNNFDTAASSIAVVNPRDICFVVDLSGSMNDDTEPAWATAEIDKKYALDGFPTVGTELMEDVYDDFGFGAYPGPWEYIGKPLGVKSNSWAYAEMTKGRRAAERRGSSCPVSHRQCRQRSCSQAKGLSLDDRFSDRREDAQCQTDAGQHDREQLCDLREIPRLPDHPEKGEGSGSGSATTAAASTSTSSAAGAATTTSTTASSTTAGPSAPAAAATTSSSAADRQVGVGATARAMVCRISRVATA